jgi:flagellar biosynthetic protein FliO
MTRYKKRIVAFLAAVAVAGIGLAVRPVQSTAVEPNKPLSDDFYSKSENDPNQSRGSFENKEWFLTMMKAVLLVVVLGAAAIYISKKLLPRITNQPGKKICIIETVHLGPRKAVHLLKISNQQLLIGSTNESITKLADITDVPKTDEGHLVSSDALSEMDLPAADNS